MEYLAYVCHLWILATSWEQYTCTNIETPLRSHRLSVDVIQVEEIVNTSLQSLDVLRWHNSFMFQEHRREMCG